MGGLKTLFFALFVVQATGALAQAASGTQPHLRLFATCAGRLSASMEHLWLFDGPASDSTQSARDQVLDLIAAVLPPGRETDVLAWQIEAKAAHANLLHRAVFNLDPNDAAWARRMADRHTAECWAFLLG